METSQKYVKPVQIQQQRQQNNVNAIENLAGLR